MKLRFCLLITLCILVLAGCKNTSQGSQKADSDKPDVQADSNAASQSDVDLRELTDLVGKSDAEVTEILGQGEETKMEKAFSWNGIILYPFWAKMPMFPWHSTCIRKTATCWIRQLSILAHPIWIHTQRI